LRGALLACAAGLALGSAACQLGWKHTSGERTLPRRLAPEQAESSRSLSVAIPEGWHWYARGGDLIATRDGVFLENIVVERIRVGETDASIPGFFPVAALSSKQWPLRTVKNLGQPIARDMSPADAAAAIASSLARDPALAELELGEASAREIAGHPAFELAFSFRLLPRGTSDLEWPFYASSEYGVQDRTTPYRGRYCGFVVGDWLYGFAYTAARRRYFDRDLATFEAFLHSVRLGDG
jgi:hypothetical protein